MFYTHNNIPIVVYVDCNLQVVATTVTPESVSCTAATPQEALSAIQESLPDAELEKVAVASYSDIQTLAALWSLSFSDELISKKLQLRAAAWAFCYSTLLNANMDKLKPRERVKAANELARNVLADSEAFVKHQRLQEVRRRVAKDTLAAAAQDRLLRAAQLEEWRERQ